MRGGVVTLVAASLAMVSISCSRGRVVDYAAYERIPMTAASTTFRALAKTNPVTAKKAFYGNYGGPGNRGGKPLDQMDELFRRHDIVYYNARTRKTMLEADSQLLVGLGGLDSSRLSSDAEEYRGRAIGFFRWPGSHVVGKPWSTFVTRREPEGSYFDRLEAVREFYGEDHPGVPGSHGRRISIALTTGGARPAGRRE